MIVLKKGDVFNENIDHYLKEVEMNNKAIVINCNNNSDLVLINLTNYTSLKKTQLEKVLQNLKQKIK